MLAEVFEAERGKIRFSRPEYPLQIDERIRDIPGYEGYYQVTDFGRVWSVKSRKWMGPVPYSKGRYLKVNLSKNGKVTNHDLHQLVCSAFNPKPEYKYEFKLEIAHKDGNGHNNRLDNLIWKTHSENELDKKLYGRGNNGERNNHAKLKEYQVLEIREKYANGIGTTQLSQEYKVSSHQILMIVQRRHWQDI